MVDVKPEWVPGVYETGACTQEQSGALLYPINVHPGHSERANEEEGIRSIPRWLSQDYSDVICNLK